MELITCESCTAWEQVLNQIYQIPLKTMMISLKTVISESDYPYYGVYIAAYFLGRKFRIKTISIPNLIPLVLALFMCQVVYSMMILPDTKYPKLAIDTKNVSLIFFFFYLNTVVYFVTCKNLWVSLSCSLMCAYMLVRMEFWKYVEIHGKAPSQLLYDAHWLVVLLLHCFIVGSFFLEHRNPRAYERLLIRFRRE